MRKTRMIQPWRKFAMACQAVVIIGLPFLEINGESALRFDVPSLELHVFGLTLWIDELFIVLTAIIFLSLLVILITVLFGRIWCGWVCPQTVIDEFTSFVEKGGKRSAPGRLTSYTATLVMSIFIAANLIWYFVSPYDFVPDLFGGNLGNVVWGAWGILSLSLFLNFLFLRQTFCSTVCPYAKLQGTLFDEKTLIVSFDDRRSKECIDCGACIRSCPAGIDIRDGQDAACIHCAECIDTCAHIMARKDRKSLIGYFFGSPAGGANGLRYNVVLIGTVTALFFSLLLYLLVVRSPLDVTVLPNHAFPPRMSSKGDVVNSYIISIKNRGRHDEDLRITVEGIGEMIKVTPDRTVPVKAGTIERHHIYVSARGINGNDSLRHIQLSVETLGKERFRATDRASFVLPGDS
jgi:cytochrome c oxidase accessory protein FixG